MPKSKIAKPLPKILSDTQKASLKNISSGINYPSMMLGDPQCPHCGGIGFIRVDVPLGHERFGTLEPCVCRSNETAQNARQRLFELSHLDRLSHLNFKNFEPNGNKDAESVAPQERQSLQDAQNASEEFAKQYKGWLLLEGGYGCGKTHLAAAIANDAVNKGVPTLFITVPDLLDSLRFAYNNPETTFEARFEEIRDVPLLVLDDFGTQNATPWAQEKLFQILNYRYINKLPTVITTNLTLDEIESRIRSRLQDSEFVKYTKITAPDYRRPKETSNPSLSLLSQRQIHELTFRGFNFREDEVGKEIVTVVTKEKKDNWGNLHKEKIIEHVKVTQDNIRTLRDAFHAAYEFAEKPDGWVVLLGDSYCGKTYLAAAIGNFRIALGGQAIMAEVSPLLDYLKVTFRPNSDVSFDRRFYEISTTPLLILDDLKESGTHSVWAEDKLYQILNHRYNDRLPTVLTSTLGPDEFAKNYPSLWNRILDTSFCQVCVIDMPPYRRTMKTRKATTLKKSKPG